MNFINELKKAKEKAAEISKNSKTALLEKINVQFIDEEAKDQRVSICLACENYFAKTGQCIKCGCFVKAKTWLKNASCPVNKW